MAAAGVLYLVAAVGYALEGQVGMASAFFAYALANAGLVVAGRGW